MSLQDEIYKRISEEIKTDPRKIGYEGKTDAEIADLLNTNPTTISTIINVDVPPISRILQGVSGTANIITVAEVTAAKSAA